MEPRVIQIGNYQESEDRKFDNPQCGRVYSVDGLSPTINTCQGGDREPKILLEMEEIKSCASRKRGDEHKIETRKDDVANCVTSIDTDSMVYEPQVINPLKGKTDKSWFFEQQVYDVNGIARAVKSTEGSGNEPKILTPLRTEEGKELRKQGIEKFSNRALYPREDGVSNTITSVQKDNLLQEPKIVGYTRDRKGNIVNHHLQDHANTIHTCTGTGRNTDQYVAENKERQPRYRIRKLTEREVFRLQDVDDEDITKIQQAGISKTAQYRLAGNSIVVSCLYHIFRKLFIQPECEEQQLSLF